MEELLEFPTAFAFKAIGQHSLALPDRALAAVREVVGAERRLDLRTRLSRNGTYLSVTLSTRIESADELRAVYAALRTVEGVITLL